MAICNYELTIVMGSDRVKWMRPNFMAHNYHDDSTVLKYKRQHIKPTKRNYVLHL